MNTATAAPKQLIIPLMPCESSQIHSHGHDAATNTLALRFKNKGGPGQFVYYYSNYTADDYAAFLAAESKGKYFGAHIKDKTDKYPFTKIEFQVAMDQAAA